MAAYVQRTSTGSFFSQNSTFDSSNRNVSLTVAQSQLTLAGRNTDNVKLLGLADPDGTNDTQAITYGWYVQNKISSWITGARARTTAALPACTYANGASGAGATLTGDSSGELPPQDGVTLVADEYLLVVNQEDAGGDGAQNGLYKVTHAGSGGASFILTRAVDMDEAAEFVSATIPVAEGATHADTNWQCTNNSNMTVGTTAVTFAAFAAGGVADDSITTAKIQDSAVTTAKLANNAVASDKINTNAVTTDKIADNAVNGVKLGNNAVTADKINDNAVTANKISNDAVTANKIANDAVTGAKLAADIRDDGFTNLGRTNAHINFNGNDIVHTCPTANTHDFVVNATTRLEVTNTGGHQEGNWTQSSDPKWKQNFEESLTPTQAYDAIDNISGVSWFWKDGSHGPTAETGIRTFGVRADHLRNVLPRAVVDCPRRNGMVVQYNALHSLVLQMCKGLKLKTLEGKQERQAFIVSMQTLQKRVKKLECQMKQSASDSESSSASDSESSSVSDYDSSFASDSESE